MMNSIVRYQRTSRQQEECDSAIGRAVRFDSVYALFHKCVARMKVDGHRKDSTK